jgi:hypothetical protein
MQSTMLYDYKYTKLTISDNIPYLPQYTKKLHNPRFSRKYLHRAYLNWCAIVRWKPTPPSPSYTVDEVTPWSRVLLEKLTGLQLVKNFPAFYGTRSFITAFSSVRPLSLSGVRSSPCPQIPLLKIHINILPSTPGSPKWSLSLRFPHQNPVYARPLAHSRYMPRPFNSRFYNLKNFGWGYRSLSSSLCSFLHSPITLSLVGSNRHPILRHPQPTFLPQCQRLSCTPTQNNRQNYSSVYLNLQIFG